MTFNENTFNPCDICIEHKCDVCILHMLVEEDLKRGKWIVGLDGSCMCSNCNKVSRYEIGFYCSYCGAKMEIE